MDKVEIAQQAFIVMDIDPENWDLPDEFDRALTPYIDSVPTSFFLPWPSTMLPAIGSKIHFTEMDFEERAVEDIEFEYGSKKGVRCFIKVPYNLSAEKFHIVALYAFAYEGWIVENMTKSVKEVLQEAGLWQQLIEKYGS